MSYSEQSEVRCKYCRERDLYWEEARDEHNRKRFVLVDGEGNIHNCPKKHPVTTGDFDVIADATVPQS